VRPPVGFLPRALVQRFKVESVVPGVESSEFQNLTDKTDTGSSLHLNNDTKGVSDIRLETGNALRGVEAGQTLPRLESHRG
jgi:hypothetical protein